MKKIFTLVTAALFVAVIGFTALAQKNEKKDNKKEHAQGGAKKQDKQTGNANGHAGNKSQDKNQGKKDDRGNDQHKNNGKGGDKDNGNHKNEDGDNGKNKGQDKNGNGNNTNGYSWNKENFKDRKKLKDQEKVTICHKFNSNNEPAVTINVSSNALQAHLNHGDVQGACPALTDNRFSDEYLRRRAAYYNDLQHTQEQVLYSRSILDYARERLNAARLQLAALQGNNLPVVEIQRKEAVVVQLERNVSLLETILGVAANLVVQKLTN